MEFLIEGHGKEQKRCRKRWKNRRVKRGLGCSGYCTFGEYLADSVMIQALIVEDTTEMPHNNTRLDVTILLAVARELITYSSLYPLFAWTTSNSGERVQKNENAILLLPSHFCILFTNIK